MLRSRSGHDRVGARVWRVRRWLGEGVGVVRVSKRSRRTGTELDTSSGTRTRVALRCDGTGRAGRSTEQSEGIAPLPTTMTLAPSRRTSPFEHRLRNGIERRRSTPLSHFLLRLPHRLPVEGRSLPSPGVFERSHNRDRNGRSCRVSTRNSRHRDRLFLLFSPPPTAPPQFSTLQGRPSRTAVSSGNLPSRRQRVSTLRHLTPVLVEATPHRASAAPPLPLEPSDSLTST
jgi:hypothetical protein